MKFTGWLILLYSLPGGSPSLRVTVWRRLKKAGAVQLKTSASLLPDTPENFELFQWLAKQITDAKGEATLVRAKEIESMSHAQVVGLFNSERGKDYDAMARTLTRLLQRKAKTPDKVRAELERVRSQFTELQRIDFFESPRAHDVRMLFQKAEKGPVGAGGGKKLKAADFRRRIWLTRPHPQIDRVGSAWLIKRCIDPDARFVFGNQPDALPDAIPYDMADVEFTHQGDDCTFETLLKRFGIRDRVLERMAEMIHDADLHDDKFQAAGAYGIDHVLAGLARLGWSDEEILTHGFVCFEALYAQVKAAS